MLIQRYDDLRRVNAKLLGNAVKNALVRLMRHIEINFVCRVAGGNERFFDHARYFLHGMTEHFASVHAQVPNSLC